MQIFKNANYDFIKWRWHALILSSVLIIGGFLLMLARGGMPLGIDFTGGTLVVVKFDKPVHEDTVRKALDVLPGDKVVQQYGDPKLNEVPSSTMRSGPASTTGLALAANTVNVACPTACAPSSSVSVMVTVYFPSSAYTWLPEIVPLMPSSDPGGPNGSSLIAPVSICPSPQSMVAVCVSCVPASVKVAGSSCTTCPSRTS